MPNKSDTTHTGPRSSRFNLKDGEQGSVKAGKRNIVRSLSASRTRNIGISFVGLLLVGLLIWLASGGRGIPNALAAVDEAPANNKAETEVVTSQISLEDLPVFTSGVNGYPGPQRRVNIHTIVPDRPRMEIITYSVTQGDSIFAIAERLVIPGGERELVSWQAPRISRSNPAVAKVAGPGACGSIYDGPIGEGFFLWPTPATYLSGYGYSSIHPGIDIGGATGNAIFASASGVVVYAGWNNYGYGYMVVIDHGDGWQSLYAHMNLVNVGCGQAVYQGNVIGGVGSTGNSSGSHLHFELQHDTYGKVNPYDLVSP
jgi:hypothetical protein